MVRSSITRGDPDVNNNAL